METNTNNTIVMIAVEDLYPHKDNPRKDLGDLSELIESIRLHGIFQNLTVVPKEDEEGKYKVVIGHRRLAAAVAAGLTEVPCVIREMSEKEQIQTMLVENITRSDLSAYEQAQGFQMMLDLGSSVADISAETGFSQTTVRKRVALLDLDKEAFEAAEKRGATLFDLAKLEELDDLEAKNEVLKSVGTNNFSNALKQAVTTQKRQKSMQELLARLDAFAERVEERDENTMTLVRSVYVGDKFEEPEDLNDPNHPRYFYAHTEGSSYLSLYREKTDGDDEKEQQRLERVLKKEQAEKMMSDINGRHHELRTDFVKSFGAPKKHAAKIMSFAVKSIVGTVNPYRRSTAMTPYKAKTAMEILGVEADFDSASDGDTIIAALETSMAERPEITLLAVAYAANEQYGAGYTVLDWKDLVVEYQPNDQLDDLYAFLESIGYVMSDEEKAMQNGTHEIFKEANDLAAANAKPEETPETDEEADN